MKTFLVRQVQKLGLYYRQVEYVKFLGKELKVIKGTIRKTHDKDDAWLFDLAKHHSNIMDVGCNIGQAAMLMLCNDSVKKIALVDPNPLALAWAAENLIMNSFSDKAHFVPAFVSDKSDERIELYTVGVGAAGSKFKGFAKTAAKADSHFTVETLTLDLLSERLDLNPDLIKVDVEGAEYEVLKGAAKLALEIHPAFFVEIHSGPELSIASNTENILDWCVQTGYRAWYMKTKELLSVEFIKNRGRYHALLLPKEQDFPEYLKTISEGSEIFLT